MKIVLKTIALLLVSVTSLFADVKKVDSDQSYIKWTGSKVTGTHSGKLTIKDGTVNFKEGQVQSGEFTFDMNSIVNEDITDPEYKKKLEDHLKSNDFFSVTDHPQASFKLLTVKQLPNQKDAYNVDGELSIKGITHPISFVSAIVNENGVHTASAKVKFDRTKWDIKYNSGKFFSLAALGDKLIYDEIEVELKVVVPAA